MQAVLSQKWWVLFIRGAFSLIFGALAILFPDITLTSLVLVFGAYALVDGGFTVYHAITDRDDHHNWGWSLAEGIISILAGLAAWVLTPVVGLTLLFIIGIYAIFTGFTQIVAAWRLRDAVAQEWLLGIAGLMSVIFGVLVFFFPLSGAFAVAMLVGFYAIAFGIMLMGVALRYRNMDEKPKNDDVGSYKRDPLPSVS